MSTKFVLKEIDQRGVATVTLNNPDRHNSFDAAIIAQLHAAFNELGGNAAVRAVILATKGKSFCAGADLSWMKRTANYSNKENLRDAQAMAGMLRCLNDLPRPTIARVQGAALGGGVGLVSCCDMAVGTPEASFSLAEVRIGLVPATVSLYVVAAIGQRAARRYFQTAERFSAETAESLGLLTSVVSADNLDKTIDELLSALLANGPVAVSTAKKLVSDVANRPVSDELIEKTSALIASCRASAEGQEGLGAFLEKRSPRWLDNHKS